MQGLLLLLLKLEEHLLLQKLLLLLGVILSRGTHLGLGKLLLLQLLLLQQRRSRHFLLVHLLLLPCSLELLLLQLWVLCLVGHKRRADAGLLIGLLLSRTLELLLERRRVLEGRLGLGLSRLSLGGQDLIDLVGLGLGLVHGLFVRFK